MPKKSEKQIIAVRITSVLGVLIGALYLPGTPVYLLGTLAEAEISIWSLSSIIISVLLLILTYAEFKGKKAVNIVVLSLLMLLNLMALLTYITFTVGTPIEESPFKGANMPVLGLLLNAVMLVLVITVLILTVKKNKE